VYKCDKGLFAMVFCILKCVRKCVQGVYESVYKGATMWLRVAELKVDGKSERSRARCFARVLNVFSPAKGY
jgi:hypothetical protein